MSVATEPSSSGPFAQWRLFAAILAGLGVMLFAWYYFALRQDYTILYHGLRPADASAIVAQLERQDVRYQLLNGGADISVPAAQADSVRLQLAASNVSPSGVEGFELFDQSDMGLTDFAQKIKYQRALQGELERTIMMMDGVVAARVHISVPDHSIFHSEQQPAKAAVTLVTRSPADQTPARVEGIRRLVAASVEDLSIPDVTILDARGETLGGPEPSQGELATDQLLGGDAVRSTNISNALTSNVVQPNARPTGPPRAPQLSLVNTSSASITAIIVLLALFVFLVIRSRATLGLEDQRRLAQALTATLRPRKQGAQREGA